MTAGYTFISIHLSVYIITHLAAAVLQQVCGPVNFMMLLSRD
jgi:hypothetical protein